MADMDQRSLPESAGAVRVTVKGRVQGVGFRPFIFQLAERFSIKGTVQNNMDGVNICAEGCKHNLNGFISAIKENAPRLSRIDEVIVEEAEKTGYSEFKIIPSDGSGRSSLVIPADSAVCDECLAEMRDPDNFRYHYPLINCTQCGPRYTIIDSLPYDRPYTVMKKFTMCKTCAEEYQDPHNRRHHAQPISCEKCGPGVFLSDMSGQTVAKGDEAFQIAADLLKKGKIVAIKGIGGYHLACNAYNDEAVRTLRLRKKRPNRPLAVMAANMETVEAICRVSKKEKEILQSPEAPIVILPKEASNGLPDSVAPGMSTLGVMLPYTPVHHLLFDFGAGPVLVMTSANPSGLPMLYKDEEAFSYLAGIADYILANNRGILHPIDDSVVQVLEQQLTFLRRARGYVPDPFRTRHPVHDIVALGPQQKNTFAIGRQEQIFIGPHIGDMENLEMADHFERELSHLLKWMGTTGRKIAVDMHPQYTTTMMAGEMDGKIIPVQHHHAHMVSCMEDNQISGPVFGVILDGTGFGEDGNIWGFEILYGDEQAYKRLAHLAYTHLPGSAKAVREPWRNAAAMLIDYFDDKGLELAGKLFPGREQEIAVIANMVKKNINSPLAGTCGRLFDAVSAILGVCEVSTYDGEAAVRLSEMMCVHGQRHAPYPYKIIDGNGETDTIDFSAALLQIVEERLHGHDTKQIVERFHETVADICVQTVLKWSAEDGELNKTVVLSGGSFHNPFLNMEISRRLREQGFAVYSHRKVPCSDGGLSLGQLVIAANKKES